MNETWVAIDIQTTGLSEQRDEIIELAAVRVEEGRVSERFHTFVCPQAELSLRVQRLTGVSPEDTAGAPEEREAVGRFLVFVGEDAMVGHDVDFEMRFLEARAGIAAANPVLDVAELARFVLPGADAFDLDTLCGCFSIERPPSAHGRGARGNAEATALLWNALLLHTARLPLPVLAAISTVLEPTNHRLKGLFEEAEKEGMARAFQERATLEELFRDFGPIIRMKPVSNPRVPPEKLDTAQVRSLFGPGGLVAQTLAGYEHRPEQARMAHEVCEAYNSGSFLMVEAGTGTGKSLAYLLPSVRWALTNREKVVISTNTKNLQEQLFFKDIPLVRRALGAEFKCALIKGRGNYLCLRKFIYLLREMDRELTAEDRPFVVPLILWAVETETGDIAENAGFASQLRGDLWARVATRPGECLGPRCQYGLRCFVRKARALSQNADIVVANHAVVFSEMGMESPVLPSYAHVVFDEAHNIEDVATEHLAIRVGAMDVYRILNRLNRRSREGAGKGLFTNIRFRLAAGAAPRGAPRKPLPGAEEVEACIATSLKIMTDLTSRAEEFFNTVGLLFLRSSEEDRIRYDSGPRRPDCWGAIEAAAKPFAAELEQLAAKLSAAQGLLEDMPGRLEHKYDFAHSLAAEAASLREIVAQLKFLMDANEEKYVYWAEQVQRRELQHVLCAAPLDIGEVMERFVYSQKSTVIFSSATLTVEGNFDFMVDRLGLSAGVEPERRRCVALGTSFDFESQVLFGVPLFLPEPGDATDQFVPRFAEMLNELLVATQGRALILFTSYEMLRRTYPLVKEALAQEGILVLGQGIDGERSKITKIFEQDISSVLMGTQSFWEGVDVPGETLSCLVLAKLPFQVHTEPIVQARCELLTAQGREPFHAYTVPVAVIRLKQGFGRLIRARTDRGVVLVCDRRLATKSYGARFFNSLPAPVQIFQDKEQMLQAVSRFLARPHGGGGGGTRQRLKRSEWPIGREGDQG